ncbi:MAG: polymer-forming cytoskeletal protein [Bacteroidetes bacterium]|nr:polymer-forming cytoskeletal protein [Bacteroidota bacterium]
MFKSSSSKAETVNSPDKLNRLVEGTAVKGDIKTDSNFRLDGELKGTLNTLGKLVVGPSGRIEGEIVCGNADIEGEVIGNIRVDGILILKSTARFTGNIIAQKVGIENGAEFNGNCHMGAGTPKFDTPAIPVSENELVY